MFHFLLLSHHVGHTKDCRLCNLDSSRKNYLIAVGTIILLMADGGIYAGLLASVMLAMTIGIQNIMCFASDEKAS